jgi:hypothetical protein
MTPEARIKEVQKNFFFAALMIATFGITELYFKFLLPVFQNIYKLSVDERAQEYSNYR